MSGRRRTYGLLVLLTALLAGMAGCVTTQDPDRESDLPWNRQQPWEGQLLMPGSMIPGQSY